MIKSALERLLDDNARFDLGARGTFNHLPMALVALSRIGATEERLIEYFRWWEENRALPRRDSDQQINRNDWQRYIGDAQMSEALADCFGRWIVDRSSAEVVSTVFPRVSGGVAAAAFHGLIRLAYGIEADHAGEIAGGLATLCSRYADLGVQVDRAALNISVEAAFVRIAEALGGAVFTADTIIGNMRAAAADPRFKAAFSCPPIGQALLEDVARASITLYWQAINTLADRNFNFLTILHMVTAGHAARVLFGRFPQLASIDAIGDLWLATCAAYAAAGAPPLTEYPLPSEIPPWERIFADAVVNNDDHVIKMTYTCHAEGAHYRSKLHHAAAARLVAIGRS
jgi:hypothetical protein